MTMVGTLLWMKLTTLICHVTGHQDNQVSYDELDRRGQLNVDMDILAKQHRIHIENEQRPTFKLPSTLDWSRWRGDHRITSWSATDALRLIYELPSRQFWTKKLWMPENASESNWPSTYNAFQNTRTPLKLWMIKWLNNHMPIGTKLLQWKCTTNNLCPRCGRPKTHHCHVLKCTHPEARALWLKSVQDLIHWMERKNTHPDLQAMIVEHLRAWYEDQPPTACDFDWPGITEVNPLQKELGWGIFYDRFLIPEWAAIQEQAYYI
jgi:hypothetical protein